jgi:hypothetical protein
MPGSAIRVGKEVLATHGTVSAGTFVTIACSFRARQTQKNTVPSEGRMGQDVHFSVIPGLQGEEFEIADSPIYHDTIGMILGSAIGPPSKVVVDTIFDNTFAFANDPNSLSIQWDQPHRSTSPFQILYAVVDELTVDFDANAELTFKASGVAMPETVISAPSYSFSTARPFSAWGCAVTKGGSGNTRLLKGSIKIKRNRKPFHAFNNTQAPTKMTIGDRSVEFDLTLDFDAVTEYTQWKNATTDILILKFEDAGVVIGGASKPALTLTMSKCAYQEAEIDDGGELPSIKIKGKALYNATDVGPMAVVLRSSKDFTVA